MAKMTERKKALKPETKQRYWLKIVSLGGVLALFTLLSVGFVLNGSPDASAKDKVNKGNGQHLDKVLKIVSVKTPDKFQGVNPYPTKALAGQKLVAVKIDFDRDFKDHLRSSETGEVYITDTDTQHNYLTVDTGIEKGQGPKKAPPRQATFVYMVPQNTSSFIFHYGTNYSIPITVK
ncbi:MAG TPA: hypothetical protein VH186_29560 [Chloroflexia bacterium]|nr:hypothetical protein [Chloroflexia bacterium]